MSDWYTHERKKLHSVIPHDHEELEKTENGHPVVKGRLDVPVLTFRDTNIPESWDWRDRGAVMPPIQQGRCGSCWTFAIAAAMEGWNKNAGGSLVRLSTQQMLDCASTYEYRNNGCKGGHAVWTWDYLAENSLLTWSDYPYEERELGYCKDTSGYRGTPRVK